MSSFQAAAFASKWTVLDQYTPTEQVPVYDNFGVIVDYVEQYTGLSATVFEEVATGKHYLAIRGTEITDLGDLTADGGILLHGIPDLSGQYQSLHAKVTEWQTNGVLPGAFTVAGHSLGGWLSEGLAVDFAASIEHTYVYNSPGLFGAGFGDLLQQINDALGTSFLSVPNLANLTNIRASAGLSLIAGLGQPLSPPIGIVTEDQTQSDVPNPAGSRNHSQRVLTDSLAVYTLFAELSSSLTVENIGAILNASGNRNAMTLEDAVNALGDLLQAGSAIMVADDRDALYTRMQDIRDSAGYQLAVQARDIITIQPLTNISSSIIAAQAQLDTSDGLAYRYALVNLNPFALTGDASLYASHNASGALDRYDPVAGTGVMTDQYIKDRAKMLSWKMQFDTGTRDSDDPLTPRADKPYTENWDSWTINGDWDFIDHAAIVGGSPLKLTIDGVDLSTTANHQIVFGTNNADSLAGDALNDNLYGGAGADTLTGNGGNDYLEGGEGNDTYIINAGDGTDTILDTDGSGSLILDGTTLTGGALVDGTPNVWKNTAQGITYTLKGSGASQVLIISKDGSSDGIRVQGWQSGQLGLAMAGAPAPAANTPIVGQDGYSDGLIGTGGDDLMQGLSGNDALDGSAGDDVIEGGLGDDLIAGSSGTDLLYGGAGKDMILSATGLNRSSHLDSNGEWAAPAGAGAIWTQGRLWGIYASSDANGPTYIIDGGGPLGQDTAGDIVFAGDDEDRVVGGLGDDYIDGGLGNDNLTGHGGNDVIDGGDGEDYLQGDGTVLPGYYTSVTEIQHGNDVLDGGADADILVGGGKDDGLFGGTGNDKLWGDDQNETLLGGQYHGSDYLDGGDNDDQLVGGGKDDFLFGGAGADMLWGDADDEADLAGQYHGNDYLDGGDSKDQLVGGGGDDILVGGIGDDVLIGDARPGTTLAAQYEGDDILYGDAGEDQLAGVGGNDDLYGGADKDTLLGEAGIDILDGGSGNDYLDGGSGADTMAGGTDDDTYIVDDAGDVVIEAENKTPPS